MASESEEEEEDQEQEEEEEDGVVELRGAVQSMREVEAHVRGLRYCRMVLPGPLSFLAPT
eukprot:1452868-Rhodomonas_salina.1